jgi:putative peptidoglycan lipid II flippase
MVGAFMAVLTTIALDILLVGPLRQGGLAIGSAAGWAAGATFLALRLRRRMGLLGGRQVVWNGFRALAAAAIAFWPASHLAGPLTAFLGPAHWLTWVVALAVMGVLGGALYVAFCWIFRVPELQGIIDIVRARLRGRTGVEPA